MAQFPKMRYSSQYNYDCASGTVEGVVIQYMAMEQCTKKTLFLYLYPTVISLPVNCNA